VGGGSFKERRGAHKTVRKGDRASEGLTAQHAEGGMVGRVEEAQQHYDDIANVQLFYSLSPTHQKIAKILGGLATPPGTLQTSLVTKKLHLFSFLQYSANFSKSNSSPIGIPHPANSTS
jgi:hypothetical protein